MTWPLTLAAAAFAALIATAGAGAATTPPQALAFLNAQRAANGLPANLTLNDEASRRCKLHDHYLALNGWDDPHNEVPGKPGYTDDGAWAGRRSILYNALTDWAHDGNPFESAPFHLADMLVPQLQSIGWDSSEGNTCMVVSDWKVDEPVNLLYTYPGDGATAVYYGESPAELPATPEDLLGIKGEVGPNIFVFADGPWAWTSYPHIVQATLAGPSGSVPIRTAGGDDVSDIKWAFTAMALIVPLKPLQPKTTYRATVTVSTTAATMTKSWSFTTGTTWMPDLGDGGGNNNAPADTTGTPTGGRVRGTLARSTMRRGDAGRTTLTYTFSKPSEFFARELKQQVPGHRQFGRCVQFPQPGAPLGGGCLTWGTVTDVRRNATNRGSHTLTIAQLFGSKRVVPGRYLLSLYSDGGTQTLRFTITP